jgi:tryptophan 2,3-dioxygenase
MPAPLTDYEKYIRTEELLALQKTDDKLSTPDEMQFQIVHQVAELWMKLAVYEGDRAAHELAEGDVAKGTRLLHRIGKIQLLLIEQIALLDTMSPRDYMIIRDALGRGSGQESPGFKGLLKWPERAWPSFEELLEKRNVTLRAVYEHPDAHAELFNVAEALMEIDQNLQLWRERHLKLVFRQIGTGTPSLKGKPSDLLAEGMRHRFFPRLWDVRDELFAQWTKTNPNGAQYGYHG